MMLLVSMGNPSPTIDRLLPALPAGGGDVAEPHGALYLVLGYLRLPDLLAFRGVCRALRDEVDADELLWRHITVDSPLSWRLTDDILSSVASFARGKLRSLALLRCPRITDAGLLQVVDQNPTITKLYIPGCTSITPDGVVSFAKRLAEHKGRLECIRINGLCNIKEEHVNVLKLLLYKSLRQEASSKSFYSYRHSLDDGRPIDVDICPMCQYVRMVYDCTREDCRTMKNRWSECRGCFFCIARCEECGGCLDAEDFGEDTACSHLFCAVCWLQLPKCNFCNLPCCKKDATAQGLSSTGFVCLSCTDHFFPPIFSTLME